MSYLEWYEVKKSEVDTNEPTCPFCGNASEDWWDGHSYSMDRKSFDPIKEECEVCGKEYLCVVDRRPRFTSYEMREKND